MAGPTRGTTWAVVNEIYKLLSTVSGILYQLHVWTPVSYRPRKTSVRDSLTCWHPMMKSPAFKQCNLQLLLEKTLPRDPEAGEHWIRRCTMSDEDTLAMKFEL